MPTIPSTSEVEEFLLGLVSRDTGVSIEDLRAEAVRCPHDPPWSSEEFVHYQFEIEEHFHIDLDPIEVEQVQRDLGQLAKFILSKLPQEAERTA